MSYISAHVDYRHPVLPAVSGVFLAVVAATRSKATEIAQILIARIQHRQMPQRFGRYSDYSLQDVGFERDWDGSILPIIR
jgi:hypothetical protein